MHRKKNETPVDLTINGIYGVIANIITSSKEKISYQVNSILVDTYYNIGKIIVENEQLGSDKAKYGKMILLELSKKLTLEFGKGFSRSNLQNMRLFFIRYRNCQPVAGNLSWSHICYLIYIINDEERKFYESESVKSRWSKRELKRQIDSGLYQRLLISKSKYNNTIDNINISDYSIDSPIDILKEPFVFEFLGYNEVSDIIESDLEKQLLTHLSSFLLELGRGFLYVGNQYRMAIDHSTHYYVDLVFYNKFLKSYVLLDLKMTDMIPEYVGQMNLYVNYFNKEIKDVDDNETVGIVLCKSKNEVTLNYALGNLSSKIFASTYVYSLPDKDELIKEVEKFMSNK